MDDLGFGRVRGAAGPDGSTLQVDFAGLALAAGIGSGDSGAEASDGSDSDLSWLAPFQAPRAGQVDASVGTAPPVDAEGGRKLKVDYLSYLVRAAARHLVATRAVHTAAASRGSRVRYIFGTADQTQQGKLSDVFAPFRPTDVYVHRDHATRAPSRFAFVTFASLEDADAALAATDG